MVLIEKYDFSNNNFLELLEARKSAQKADTVEFEKNLANKNTNLRQLTVRLIFVYFCN